MERVSAVEIVAELQAVGVPVSASQLSTSLSEGQRLALAFQMITCLTEFFPRIGRIGLWSGPPASKKEMRGMLVEKTSPGLGALVDFVFFFYVGDAGNTSLVGAGTPLGATTVVTPGSVSCVRWECCILASL